MALPLLMKLQAEWATLRNGPAPAVSDDGGGELPTIEPPQAVKLEIVRAAYEHAVSFAGDRRARAYADDAQGYMAGLDARVAEQGQLSREIQSGNTSRWAPATERMLINRGFSPDRSAAWFQELVREVAIATVEGQGFHNRVDKGETDPTPLSAVVQRAQAGQDSASTAVDLPFSDLTAQFMRQWLAGRSGSKETNTEQQKRATFGLFAGFWRDKPIRAVTHADAAAFHDKLRLFDPNWARSPKSRSLQWSALVEQFSARERGLSHATMNRHLQVLQELWSWAKKRDHCAGDNPFEGFRARLRPGINVRPYVAWETHELRELLSPPPKRKDLLEIIIVGMFTGMRLDEIASLTWAQVKSEWSDGDDYVYLQVVDAKTPAGNRKVPIHPALGWLIARRRGADGDRLWPGFNEEGKGMKPGADAGREFSRFKQSRGFSDRTKTFHSFRKNVTRMMERAKVPENDWAQIFGHERGFTYSVYNPDGIDMRRRAEIIGLINYPELDIPFPAN